MYVTLTRCLRKRNGEDNYAAILEFASTHVRRLPTLMLRLFVRRFCNGVDR
jgi:hypothetical protein